MDDSHSKNLNFNKEEDDKAKRGRRSKADVDGRSYECNLCHKSYLSYPALYTHKKIKHKENSEPAKDSSNSKIKINNGVEDSENTGQIVVSAESMDYFSTVDRKGQTEHEMFANIFKDVYIEIFIDNWDLIYKTALDLNSPIYSEWNFYPLYLETTKHRNHDSTHSNSSGNLKCDQVFSEYILAVSEAAKPEYFKRVLKFVFLYREYLNKYHRKPNETEYTIRMTAEDAPDISNEFLIEFIVLENSKMGYSKEEAINLTQNFCRWMFNESYTTSKLSIK